MSNLLLRDIFKLPLSTDIIECYRILGYEYMHIYQLHIKYDRLRSQARDATYYNLQRQLKLLQSQLPNVNYTTMRLVFYHVLKKNI